MGTWVDFKELRAQLKFAEVLDYYHVQLKVRGDRASGICPLPGHAHKQDGKRHSPSFSCNLTRGIFQCFSCGGKGNTLDFACLMDGGNPNDPAAIRRAAISLHQRFGAAAIVSPAHESKAVPSKTPVQAAAFDGTVVINAPLDFELQHLDPTHPYLISRGFTSETIRHFGLGFCAKGMMANRIAIPLHDALGNLVGYAGRLVDDAKIDDENPKYRFPGPRARKGIRYEFHKSRILYNGFRVGKPVPNLIVVEGFPSVWWLWQHDFRDVVAVMGSSCGPEQGAQIVALCEPDGLVTIFTDGDEPGGRCATSIFSQIAQHRSIRWARLEAGKQPTECTAESLNELVEA